MRVKIYLTQAEMEGVSFKNIRQHVVSGLLKNLLSFYKDNQPECSRKLRVPRKTIYLYLKQYNKMSESDFKVDFQVNIVDSWT